ncbi:hypothetical protein Syun_005993 [Stephania yunnanensis]|uniref:Uncharacterized protein n=1 Tax=Stephania yunnanensis TaxID=152371 RepID=A0AAP0PX50_9MAGN
MARHGCINGTLDDSKYSSPMPIIGLYIAIATSVCFFSILFDVISGFRNRKRWLPCRFFSLNSVTLTLLAIAAKIPVDLTTKMPSAHDQLSKLTGTALICICMGFMMPSLGINRESENWSNVMALSILVVTVVVNICIQLYTGVIIQKGITVALNKDRFKKGEGSMLQRLKLCYLYAYHSNPQIELCKDADSASTSIICIVSSVVLLQAALRCFIKKNLMFPCNGLSDYEWSTWIIVGTQIATILIGSIGTCFRFFSLVHHMKCDSFGLTWAERDVNVINENPLLKLGIKSVLVRIPIYLMYLVIAPYAVVRLIWERCRKFIASKHQDRNNDGMEEYSHLIDESDAQGLEVWILRKGVRDMKRWMELSRSNELNQSIKQLLSNAPCAPPNLLINQLKYSTHSDNNKAYEVSSLSVVLLARIATVCSHSAPSLSAVLSDIFEVIHFVEMKMNSSTSFQNKKKSKFAKAAFQGPSSRDELLKVFKISDAEAAQLNVLGKLRAALPSDDPVQRRIVHHHRLHHQPSMLQINPRARQLHNTAVCRDVE